MDSDPTPLRIWRSNVRDGKAVLLELGPSCKGLQLPPSAPDLHLHASPPCVVFSRARANSATSCELKIGTAQIRWFLDLVVSRREFSWSMENVNVPAVRNVLAEYTSKHPNLVRFAVFDAATFGSPQNRQRVIAGPPALIRKLQETPVERRVCVREAFEHAGQTPASDHFKNNTTNRDNAACTRSTEECAFTVCAGHALTWSTRDGNTVSVMTSRESAILMGFPKDWRLPSGSRASQKAVGT